VLALAEPDAWNDYLDELAAVADVDIASYDDLLAALAARCEVFHQAGCRLSDHALVAGLFAPASAHQVRASFDRLRSGVALPAAERDQLTTALLLELGRLYSAKGWTMQLRFGALRDTNSAMHAVLGSDSGFDAMGDRPYAEALARFLDALAAAGSLPKTILYNVNPRDTEMLASMLACFEDGTVPGKMQLGPAWWFLDQQDGIERQLEAVSQIGSLRRFVGMVADSRSFLSFTRHEYFRRILCNRLGADMAAGLLPRDFELVGALVEDVCFRNAASFFGFELPDRRSEGGSAAASALQASALR
jgi:glucuronate isomerase